MVGILTLWVLMQIICNWFDGQASIMTATDMTEISKMDQYVSTTGVEQTGETSNVFQWLDNVKNAIVDKIEFNYSFWYSSVSASYDATTCSAAGGAWKASKSGVYLCYIPSPWEAFHSAFLRPIGWAVLLALVALTIGKFVR